MSENRCSIVFTTEAKVRLDVERPRGMQAKVRPSIGSTWRF